MKHFISSFSAAGLLAVMIISSCELPKFESRVRLLSTSITGTVTNPAGNPIDGVEVSVGSVSVQSGKDGTFKLEGVTNVGTVILSTKKAGYNDYRKFIEVPAGTTKHDIQPSYAYTTTVTGKLSDPPSGPVDKSNFTITSSTGGKTATTKGHDGNYTIEVEHAGEFTLTATAPDKRLIGRRKIKAATTAEKPVSKKDADPIELERNVNRFTLVLKDPLGNAITSPVYTAAAFTSSSGAAVEFDTTAPAPPEGSYKLQVLIMGPEPFTVTVAAQGLFGENESAEIDPAAAAGTNYPVTVPYRYTTTVSGRVTAGTAPIDDADISVTSTGSGANERRAVISSTPASRKTDSEGNYSITVNHQGDFNIQAEKAGYSSPDPLSVRVAGAPLTRQNFVLTPIRKTVTGLSYTARSLVLARNEALTPDQLADLRPSITPAGAVVTYSVDPALPAGLELDTSSGEITGTPTAITAAGDYLVTAQGDTAAGYSGSASHTINIRVNPVTGGRGITTGGRVTAARFTLELKDPLGNAITSPVYTAADFNLSSGAAVEFDATAPAPPEGSYKLQVLTTGPGTFKVTVRAKGLFGEKESADIDPAAAAGTNYRVTVPYRYTTTVSGRVTAGTTPIEDADISVTSTGSGANERRAVISSTPASRKTDSEGNYSITVNHQGDFNIRAEKAGYRSPAAPVTVSGTGGTETENFALTRTVTGLSYTARSLVLARNEALTPDQLADLRPSITPAGAVVTYSVDPALPAGLELDTSSGEITGTPTAITAAGDYLVTAQGDTAAGYSGSASHTINIRVNPVTGGRGITTGGRVTAARFTLELKDPLDNPIPGYRAADFTLSSGAAVEFDTTAPAPPEGSYKLQVLTTGPGTFTVTVAAKDLFGEKESAEINPAAAAGTNYPVTVPYQYTTTVSGGVTRGTTPIDDADISVISTGTGANERLAVISSTPASRKTDSEGNYSITVNHQGDFNIRAEKAGYRSPAAPVTVSGTGGTETENFALTRTVTGLSYTARSLVLARNEALTPDQLADLRPSITPAGAVVTYSVDPALPAGLTLDTSTGRIIGTPTAITAAGDYLVTAQGDTAAGYSGEASHTINIRVGVLTRFTLELKDHLGNPILGYTAADFTLSSGAVAEFDTTAPAPPEGSYKLQVLTTGPGTFTVTVAAKGLFGENESADIDPAAAGTNYRVTVPYRYTTTVSGRVTAGTAPIDDADISVRSTGSGANERLAVISSRPANPRTDNLGRYSITVNHQGDFTVRAEKADYIPSSVSVSGTGGIKTRHDIALTQIQELTGLSYGTEVLVLSRNEALTDDQLADLEPRIEPAGAVVTYSVDPPLPPGLTLDTSTGRITGTPTEESQIHTRGGSYIGRDYTVTAQGNTSAGYIGSASHSILLRVGRALPRNLSYGSVIVFHRTWFNINQSLKVIISPFEPSRPHGIVDDHFEAEFVRIPETKGCWSMSSRDNISENGTVEYNAYAGGLLGSFIYKLRVKGTGQYGGARIVKLFIHVQDRTADSGPTVHCYE